ncbi:MAG: adenylosuccinate lyase [Bdellovibrionota bacterium]
MITRYTRPEMGLIWDDDNKFSRMLEVEMAVADVQAEMKLIPREAAKAIRQKGKFSRRRIHELEKTLKHDVIAFVSNVAENVGPLGKYIHFGLTSSDVLDTALSLQMRDAGEVLLKGVSRLEKALRSLVREHRQTLCLGRTHGMYAEPTTFGFKMSGFLAEIQRNTQRLNRTLKELEICKLSGPVGTYSTLASEVEAKVAAKLKLTVETVATQVVPRDRHADLMLAISLLGGALERLSVELRHLQRSEVAEVTESFTAGQRGSSAMPHKKNPISSENITGLSRLLRGYAFASLENIPLWHERDISHSSVERVAFPDAFILVDYAVHRMSDLLEGLKVDKKRMLQNIQRSQGQVFTSVVLNHLVVQGLTRDEAYMNLQRVSHSMGEGDQLQDLVLKDKYLKKYLTKNKAEEIFSGAYHRRMIAKSVDGALKKLGGKS